MAIDAWRLHDTGLVAAPGPFRRLPGRVRHHGSSAAPWPDRVALEVVEGALVVTAGTVEVARWPQGDVRARVVGAGPPVSFVLQTPDGERLLAAAATPATDALLASLTG